MCYVAYSRSTSLEGLFIIGDFIPSKKRKSDPTEIEISRLRKRPNTYIPEFSILADTNYVFILSHNVESLNARKEYLLEDPVFKNASVLLLQETWLKRSDNVDLEGYEELLSNFPNIGQSSRGFGTICYIKQCYAHEVTCKLAKSFYNPPTRGDNSATHGELTMFKWKNCFYVNIYKSPTASLTDFKVLIDDAMVNTQGCSNVLVAGDFNINFLDQSKTDNFLAFMKDYELEMISPKDATTNGDTCLDAMFGKGVFNNQNESRVTIYDALFSYHKPLILKYK